MNIYQKIVEVRKHIQGFSKDKKSYGYDYVSGNQILRAVKDKMDELQLLLMPSIDSDTLKWEKHEYITSKGKSALDFIVEAKMTYTWVNAESPEEQIIVPWVCVGQQADDIAKAMGTAMTYNERYFLLKFFGLPTDEDDADARQLKEDDRPAYTNSKSGDLSEAQVKRLFAIGSSNGFNTETVMKAILKDYNKTDAKKLTKTEYDALCKRMDKKG
ncbi:MAG: ERF family protein [Peptostreptococcaceae bacterium]